ncbi:T9SS type A sorting domain-containing protein [Flavobacterium sp. Sd200]|uniref:T9SS type A sorting domain-containing protein n=1 Tax=Flavobacterium sp. Sd200 TaxID=2692211 RepID=UPI00137128E4|nr:T9SS type A sorting domain-containing protein [Flavobacterium sp. Sd200]MXN92980.1 T9SS type A sorting domain-containing protein [Flavobacterium sp. Sd200]
MKRILLSAGMLCASLIASAQCEPQTTLNEDFSDFTVSTSWAGGENCWNKIALGYPNGGMVYTAQEGAPANKFMTFYASTAVNVYSYLIGPEVSTFDGEHQLSFSTWKVARNGSTPAGIVTIQVGTITNVADGTTFVPFGDAFTVSTEGVQTFSEIIIPQVAAGSHIAFRLSADTQHNALAIDDVVWEEVPAPACEAVATIDEDFTGFSTGAFPQNCWTTSHAYPMTSIDADAEGSEEKSVTVYSFFSPNTPIYVVSPEVSTMDGNHELSFSVIRQAPVMPGSSISVQVGTLSIVDDYTTFVPFGNPIAVESTTEAIQIDDWVLPESTTQKYITFQVTATAQHTAIALDNVVWEEVPAPACAPVATIDEDFTNFADGAFPQNCWTSSHQAPMTSIDAEAEGSEEKYVTVYSFFSANTPIYVVSPEVSTMDGNHELSFSVIRQAPIMPGSSISVQVGTLSIVDDYTTFVPFGNPIAVESTTEAIQINDWVLPESTTQKYIAFQVTATAQHTAIALDNVSWQSATTDRDAFKTNTFRIFPNPTTDKNVTLAYNNINNGRVSVYTVTGAKVFETAVSGNTQNISLSSLSAGMYVVKLESGNFSATQKLIIK